MIEFKDRSIYGHKSGIYMIKNLKNNKVYVGKTQQPFYKRYQLHDWQLRQGRHDNEHLQRSYNKYGENNFVFTIVECADNWTDDEYNQKEIFYIAEYKQLGLSYNILVGGEGATGRACSEYAKKIIGQKNRINMTGKKHSEETKQKMSLSRTGKDYHYQRCNITITKDIAKRIKQMLITGIKPSLIAKQLNINYKIVNSIMSNDSWKIVKIEGWEEWYKNHKRSNRLSKNSVIEICNLYLNEKKSIEYLAMIYNRTPDAMCKLLQRHNLITV